MAKKTTFQRKKVSLFSNKISKKLANSRKKAGKQYRKGNIFAQNHPFRTFFAALGVLLIVIILGSAVFKTKPAAEVKRTQVKTVEVFRLGQSPTISVQAEVKKSGVIKIVAQTPGIISSISTTEGTHVYKGQTLVSLASNYQGGNAFSLQRQLAGLQYQNTKDTFDAQKELIQRQRDLVNKQSENSDELRKITQNSVEDTQSLVDLNSTILTKVKNDIKDLETNNVGGANDSAIFGLQQLQAQVQGGTNQLRASLRASQYQVNDDKPAQKIEDITKDIALKQIDLQEKALKLGLEISSVQLRLAKVQEANMFPSAPMNATIQKVHVKVGESVSPGTPLVTLSGDGGSIIVDAKVTQKTAASINMESLAKIIVGGKTIEVVPTFISTEATSGQLYSVIFYIDESYKKLFTDNAFITVDLPVEIIDTGFVFIPVDSVFQTQDEAFVFVVNGKKAQSKKVNLGQIMGEYVIVEGEIGSKDTIILNRSVSEGEEIQIQN